MYSILGCITDDDDDDEDEEDEEGAATAAAESERRQRVENSIREREREVQRSMACHLRDRDKERDFYRHEEARNEFEALLTDLVRSNVGELSWKEVKKLLKEDERWDSCVAVLTREEMEELFTMHCESIGKKKKQRFRELLEEAHVTLHSHWKDVRRRIKDDPRYLKFSQSERKCEREFELYLKDMHTNMKNEFRELLKVSNDLCALY